MDKSLYTRKQIRKASYFIEHFIEPAIIALVDEMEDNSIALGIMYSPPS